jgi:hypothetical protein
VIVTVVSVATAWVMIENAAPSCPEAIVTEAGSVMWVSALSRDTTTPEVGAVPLSVM